MRSFILIALCVALASANFYNKNRFYKLLNIYQHPQWYNLDRDMYGYTYPEKYIGDYDVDDIRRGNIWRLTNDIDLDYMLYDNLDTQDLLQRDLLFGQDYDDIIRRDILLGQDKLGFDDIVRRDLLFGQDKLGFDDTVRRDLLFGQDKLGFDDTVRRDLLFGQDKLGFDDIVRRNVIFGEDKLDWEDVVGRDVLYGDDEWMGGYGQLKEVRDANVKLATRLYKQTKDDKDDKNIVVSPLSIQLALSALNKGARGNTKRQIGRVIGGRLQTQERRQIMKLLTRQFKGLRYGGLDSLGYTTKINPVTLIAITKTTPAQQWFIQLVRGELGGNVKHFNFHRQPHVSRKIINNWISQKTNMKINHIVPRDAITDNTKMVLVNALEMKAPWGKQMLRHVTKEAKFYPLETNKVKIVEVMETVGRFKYYEDELVKIVGIPTAERELTFYMIVPKHKDGLVAVEKLHLQDSVQLKKVLEKTDIHVRQVGVQLPKFQIKHKIDVRRTLRNQGVTDAFNPLRADFSGITGVSKTIIDNIDDKFQYVDRFDLGLDNVVDNFVGLGVDQKVHLNKFIHQATIKITENGITAATGLDGVYDDLKYMDRNVHLGDLNVFDRVTGLMGGDLMGEKMVKANRAFAFVVKHNPTNQLILVGRVIDAAQKKINDVYQTINNVDQL